MLKPRAERRHLTVLFCDVVDSTRLSGCLDPEDLDDLLRRFHALCESAMTRHGGFVARYMGDGMLVYFGYPVAYEDAADRAVRAGIEVLRSVESLVCRDGTPVQVRVAAASGLAVVGEALGTGPASEIAVAGQVAHLASRILAFAPPGSFAIAESTRRLIAPSVACQSLGAQTFRGIGSEVPVWRVLPSGRPGQPLHDLHQNAVTRFVGRSAELDALQADWRDACNGRGRMALVVGEPGIGKSALVRHFEAGLDGRQPFVRIMLQCTVRHAESMLYPVVAHLKRAAHIQPGDGAETQLAKLDALLPPQERAEGVALLASLLSVPLTPPYSLPALPPMRQKAMTLQLILRYLLGLAEQAPVLLQVEDAHWLDPTSAELAQALVPELAGRKILLILTSRSGNVPAWCSTLPARTIALEPMAEAESRRVVEAVFEGHDLPDAWIEQIVAKSEGVPLFAEELAKTVIESAPASCGQPLLHIPASLHDSLLARLDRLGPGKEIAQIGAAFGRRFSLKLLCTVTGRPADGLHAAARHIVAAGLATERTDGEATEFTFKHALVQEAAYETMLRSRRRQLHAEIARAIEQGCPALAESEPETLAHHFAQAGDAYQAASFGLKAGQRSVARAANTEAIRHLRAAIELLALLPQGSARDALDFNLHLSLGQASYVVLGPTAALTIAAYTRAQELVDSVGQVEQRYVVLYGIFSGYHFASRFDLAREPARRVLEMATREGSTGHVCQAHRMLGYIAFFRGETSAALHHFHALTALYVPEQHGALASRFGADCRIGAMGFQSLIDCVCGTPDGALVLAQDNLVYAQQLGHPASLGWAYASMGYLSYYRCSPELAVELTEAGMRYCEQNNVGSWYMHCRAFHIWGSACLSPQAGQLDALRQVIADTAAGNGLGLPLLRSLLAELLLRRGQPEAALAEVGHALTEMHTTSQHFFEPSIHLMRGSCLQHIGHAAEQAVQAFAMAADSAHRMGARLLEYRARCAWAGLLQGAARRQQLQLTRALARGIQG